MTNMTTNNTYQVFLKDLKARVPGEKAPPATVRQWLLQLLKNRKIDLAHGPNAFNCSWSGAELHSLHPNHIFGFFTSHGVDSQSAHMLVGDVMECLEHYRKHGSSGVAEDQDEPEDIEIPVDWESEPLLGNNGSSDVPSTGWGRVRYVIVGAIVFVVVGLAVVSWWVVKGW
ncbi:hypothetical protein C8035_v011460 [Colletotrichum spinosum]|uniref:Uncharacterized protein n=1 Tax=Colletotrichum spinosum TaxID=1347390 RepID=A0A4R8QGZ8_9PEZI|nr:hypothetical protein C8035_v011460 [Colletotrichum spinosum]